MEEWPTGSAILSINGVARDNGAVVPYLGVFFHLPSESHLGELLNTQIFSLHLGLSQNLLWVYPKVLNHKSSSSDFDESWGLRTTARSPFMQVVTNANVKELKMVTRLYKKMVSKRGSWMTFQSSRECFRIDSSYGKKKKGSGGTAFLDQLSSQVSTTEEKVSIQIRVDRAGPSHKNEEKV